MSTYFSIILKAGERQREFNFRLVSNGSRYSVDVPDDKGNRIVFSMYVNADGEWKTTGHGLPMWVFDAEPALANAIEQHNIHDTTKK